MAYNSIPPVVIAHQKWHKLIEEMINVPVMTKSDDLYMAYDGKHLVAWSTNEHQLTQWRDANAKAATICHVVAPQI